MKWSARYRADNTFADMGPQLRFRYLEKLRRTNCGTARYQAPEQLGLLAKQINVYSRSYTKNVDLWAFAVLVQEVLTSQIPFIEKAATPGSTIDSSTPSPPSTQLLDMELLYHYGRGEPFPSVTLRAHGASLEGINFVKSLMVPNPMYRVSAADALRDKWFSGKLGSAFGFGSVSPASISPVIGIGSDNSG